MRAQGLGLPYNNIIIVMCPVKFDFAFSQQSRPESLPTANAHKSGLSWMKKDSNQIFSKQES